MRRTARNIKINGNDCVRAVVDLRMEQLPGNAQKRSRLRKCPIEQIKTYPLTLLVNKLLLDTRL
jgi:hypothetical protein